jgi:hypothetical protein
MASPFVLYAGTLMSLTPPGSFLCLIGLVPFLVMPLACAACIEPLPHLAKHGMRTMGTVFLIAAVFFLWRLRSGS